MTGRPTGDGEADRPRTGLAPGRDAPGRDAAWAALPHEAQRPHGIPPSRRLPALRRSLAREATDSTLHPTACPVSTAGPGLKPEPWEQRPAPSPLTGEAEAAENPTEPGSRSRARPGCRRAWAKLAAGRAPGPGPLFSLPPADPFLRDVHVPARPEGPPPAPAAGQDRTLTGRLTCTLQQQKRLCSQQKNINKMQANPEK